MAKKAGKTARKNAGAAGANQRGRNARELTAESGGRQKPVSKKPRPVPKEGDKGKVAGMIAQVAQFLREVKIELSKVTWPSRRDTIASTSVVLVIVILVAAFLGLVDLGLSRILKIVLS